MEAECFLHKEDQWTGKRKGISAERKEEYELKPCYNFPPSVSVSVQAPVEEIA